MGVEIEREQVGKSRPNLVERFARGCFTLAAGVDLVEAWGGLADNSVALAGTFVFPALTLFGSIYNLDESHFEQNPGILKPISRGLAYSEGIGGLVASGLETYGWLQHNPGIFLAGFTLSRVEFALAAAHTLATKFYSAQAGASQGAAES